MRDRKKNRLINYDYTSDGLYFITSCTNERIHCFGEINNGVMALNEIGEIANNQWEWLINRYAYLKSHAFVVMPNHVHGIIEIDREMVGFEQNVGEGRDLPLQNVIFPNNIQSPKTKIKSLSELIGAYKTTSSKKIHLLGYQEFTWQRSFHDRIIKNVKSYNAIMHYIENNPMNWYLDMFNKK